MIWFYGILTAAGWALLIWACAVNPVGAARGPEPLGELYGRRGNVPLYTVRTRRGPYRWMDHPMYIGEWLAAVGMAGLAAGIWNALAAGLVAELLLREWIIREEG